MAEVALAAFTAVPPAPGEQVQGLDWPVFRELVLSWACPPVAVEVTVPVYYAVDRLEGVLLATAVEGELLPGAVLAAEVLMSTQVAGETRSTRVVGAIEGGPMAKISFYRGDSHKVSVQVKADGVLVDLTGASAVLSAKRRASDAAYLVQKAAVVTDGPAGKLEVAFLPADTAPVKPGGGVYDVQVTLADGSVYTVLKGEFEVLEDVTVGP